MKRFLAAAAVLLMMGAVCFAQDKKAEHQQKKNNYWEQIKAEKVGFITQKLDLSVEEAQAFWPVYNQYQKACGEAGRNLRHATKALKPKTDETVSDKEMTERVNAYIKAKKESDGVLEVYNKEFLKVLPAEKVAKLYMAEEQFKKIMFDKFAHEKQEHRGRPAEKPVQPQPKPVKEGDCQSCGNTAN